MEIQVNYWAVLWAAVSSMVVGGVWYSKPVMGEQWARLVKLNSKQMQRGAAFALVQAAFSGLLTALVLAGLTHIVHQYFFNSFIVDAVFTAFWVWLGFVATTIVTHNAFEQRRKKLTLITLAHELITLLFMGAIIGWFGL